MRLRRTSLHRGRETEGHTEIDRRLVGCATGELTEPMGNRLDGVIRHRPDRIGAFIREGRQLFDNHIGVLTGRLAILDPRE